MPFLSKYNIMQTEQEINAEITKTMLRIQKDFPELSKYVAEMPVTIPTTDNPEITLANLKDYSNSLNSLITKYSKNTNL